MKISKVAGDLLLATPETSPTLRRLSQVLPPGTKTIELGLAAYILIRHNDVSLPLGTVQFLSTAVEYANINPALTLASVVVTDITGRIAMALLERILKPIIEAQKVAVWEKAEAEKKAALQQQAEAEAEKFAAWKQKQTEAGVVFVDDLDEPV